jgi:hypothetical protein
MERMNLIRGIIIAFALEALLAGIIIAIILVWRVAT